MANKAAGKGYENDNHYTDIKFQFLGIENIHVMRASLQKLLDGMSLSLCMKCLGHHNFVHFPIVYDMTL